MIKGTRIRVTNAYPVDGASPGVNYWIRGREGVVIGVTDPIAPDPVSPNGEPLVAVRIRQTFAGRSEGHYLAFLYPSELEIIA